ncbi:FtsW/RodA/SpoVE family cell cycle protein [Parafannyhessea umbonata]|uniref:Probable peptidoglycan glycosyltransferase FtsW n=1 Tax=Parafannyhessea umbonata TaxID=604330 RepID=A0A1H1L2A1_9ACTN|nr:putative peptidoglycan glycosyltransferase FtsW [Parafannyhessea umbonata]SDR68392.1 cell division protein FtsW [Parafannyhessea umbonata]
MQRVESAGQTTARRTVEAGHGAFADRYIFGVPARFMAPRLLFLGAVAFLALFGLTMIYSSSSITALSSADAHYNAAFYLQRQLLFGAVGIVLAFVIARFDYHLWVRKLLVVEWLVTLILLLLVLTPFAGSDAYGATRWIQVGPVNLQPSEFAKITLILVAANLISEYYEGTTYDSRELITFLVFGIVVPALLILRQPDKGTFTVVAVTLIIMLYFGGAPGKLCIGLLVLGIATLALVSYAQPYSRARIEIMMNPWSDPYDKGYQLVQGLYAFGSGGVFGVGIGMSKQKYSYLPMAYNDFIFAVVGEELGLVGTLGMVAAFVVLLWAGLKIARYAPDLSGQLAAVGCTFIIVAQMLLNVSGVLCMFPLSGKPIPFVSYGGSSIMSSLMLAGVVMSVSLQSKLPQTEYDDRRSEWSVTSAPRQESFVGEPTPRSARRTSVPLAGTATSAEPTRGRFTVLGGGREPGAERAGGSSTSPEQLRREREMRARANGARVTSDRRGRTRIDLGPSASDRLRTRNQGPEVRGYDGPTRDRRRDRRGR